MAIPRKTPWVPEPGVAYMPVPRCDQCRYWGAWVPAQRAGVCQVNRHTGDESPRPHTARIHMQPDIIGGGVELLTQPDFGCVQWEQK